MANVTPPYFFDEFLLPTTRKTPTARERELGFTLKDLDWLHTLIHEITHLKSLTEDLAYLDSMRPFPDLINVNISGAKLMQTDLADLRLVALSTLTPASLLFKTWDEFSQEWEHFGSHSGTSPLKDKVLSTTGGRTLDEARSIFMSNVDKRIDTILANADSVTYLISQIGRVLDAGA